MQNIERKSPQTHPQTFVKLSTSQDAGLTKQHVVLDRCCARGMHVMIRTGMCAGLADDTSAAGT